VSVQFDYTFQLDGTIEVRVSASGYLQGGVWNAEQNPYGHQIHHSYMGSLHDHIINCESSIGRGSSDVLTDQIDKIDFDIAGTKNSFMQVALEVEEIESDWLDEDDWGTVGFSFDALCSTLRRVDECTAETGEEDAERGKSA
jgi:primary-amine oxidase